MNRKTPLQALFNINCRYCCVEFDDRLDNPHLFARWTVTIEVFLFLQRLVYKREQSLRHVKCKRMAALTAVWSGQDESSGSLGRNR